MVTDPSPDPRPPARTWSPSQLLRCHRSSPGLVDAHVHYSQGRANIEKRQQFNPVLTLTQAVSNVETYPKMRNVNSLHAVQHSKGMRLRDP
ncbi:hypothetical protein AV530_019267 [Patagioenas fasciata monilis]|uniref:Uncharacterized protein n=1 Tax=Patagioenas fasciata monilis TaxID=372326 RepID=A0A1V4JD90_PATFA|nr:hypothetical protein AV530_019267 [Patagioenas fasciata monilis]